MRLGTIRLGLAKLLHLLHGCRGKPTAMKLTVSGDLACRSDFCDNTLLLADACGATGDGSGGKASFGFTGMGVSADFTVAGTLRQVAMSRRC